ncbi:hypothetical protein H696_06372, partial [Fonticula alba]
MPDVPGKFDPLAAASLGVPKGPLFGRLQRGETITLDNGATVSPGQCIGQPRRGGAMLVLDTPDRATGDAAGAALRCWLAGQRRRAVPSAEPVPLDEATLQRQGFRTLASHGHLAAEWLTADVRTVVLLGGHLPPGLDRALRDPGPRGHGGPVDGPLGRWLVGELGVALPGMPLGPGHSARAQCLFVGSGAGGPATGAADAACADPHCPATRGAALELPFPSQSVLNERIAGMAGVPGLIGVPADTRHAPGAGTCACAGARPGPLLHRARIMDEVQLSPPPAESGPGGALALPAVRRFTPAASSLSQLPHVPHPDAAAARMADTAPGDPQAQGPFRLAPGLEWPGAPGPAAPSPAGHFTLATLGTGASHPSIYRN